jgi:3-dehydroquinate dehydratase II
MTDRRRLLLVNGPNLNLLGSREPEIYGATTLREVEEAVIATSDEYDVAVRAMQSNHEGALIDAIHDARLDCCGVVINPGGYGHTSIALADALAAVALPIAEVHITNIHRREAFRHHSYVSAVSDMVVAGAGVLGYELAARYLSTRLHTDVSRSDR